MPNMLIKTTGVSLSDFVGQSQEVITTIKAFIYGFFLYLGIDMDVVQVLFILMIVDTILGATKALRLGGQFSFKRLMWGMVTKLAILFIPMLLAIIAKGLSLDFRWFVIAVLDLLIVAEGFSCFSNILSIKTKKNIENVDFITLLLRSIRGGLSRLIYKTLDEIELKDQDDK